MRGRSTHTTFFSYIAAYKKFMLRMTVINICALPRRYKIAICRQSLEKQKNYYSDFPFYMHGYDTRCRKYRIGSSNERGLTFQAEQHALRCPPVKNKLSEVNLDEDGNYYISTGISACTATFLHRQNRRGQKLRILHSSKTFTYIAQMIRDTQRDRFIPYPSKKEWTSRARQNSVAPIMNEINSQHSTAYELLNRISEDGSDNVFHTTMKSFNLNPFDMLANDIWLAEELLISFSKVTTTTQSKFSKYSILRLKLTPSYQSLYR